MELKFQVQARIQKPVEEVFDGVYNPTKITQYFATESASGPLTQGSRVIWRFADYPEDVPLSVKEVIVNQLIAFEWEAGDGYNTRVEIHFESLGKDGTLVKISESAWQENQTGLDRSYQNCQGWMNMVSCLKAYLEYGINLRKGFFGDLKGGKDALE